MNCERINIIVVKNERDYENGRRKKVKLTVRVTEAERDVIKQNAMLNEMNVSDYLSKLGLERKELKISPDVLENLSLELNAIRRKIEQLANNSNIENEEIRYREIKDVVEEMQNVIFKTISELYDKYM